MTVIADSPAAASSVRTVVFVPSGRPDGYATAPMSFDDFLRLDLPGPSEWVDGEVRLYMSVTREHQRLVDFLNRLLGMFVEMRGLGIVTTGPYPVRMAAGGPGREPDLVFVTRERQVMVLPSHLAGAPDLAIEVVSEDSVSRDYIEKLREYEAAGVREYWVLDARNRHERADFYRLEGGRFVSMPVEDGVFRSTVVDGFWMRVEWLFEREANAARALEELLGRKLG